MCALPPPTLCDSRGWCAYYPCVLLMWCAALPPPTLCDSDVVTCVPCCVVHTAPTPLCGVRHYRMRWTGGDEAGVPPPQLCAVLLNRLRRTDLVSHAAVSLAGAYNNRPEWTAKRGTRGLQAEGGRQQQQQQHHSNQHALRIRFLLVL